MKTRGTRCDGWLAGTLDPVVSGLLLGQAHGRPGVGLALASIWAVDDGEKIFRENITSPLKAKNSVWDGKARLALRRAE